MRFQKIFLGLITALLASSCSAPSPKFEITGQQPLDSALVSGNMQQKSVDWLSASSGGILVSLRDSKLQQSPEGHTEDLDWVNITPEAGPQGSHVNILHPKLPNGIHVTYGFAAKDGGFWGIGSQTSRSKGKPAIKHDYLLKVDALGNVTSTKQLSHDWHSMTCGIETKDGLILTGWKNFALQYTSDNTTSRPEEELVPSIEKIDRQGKTLWQTLVSRDDDGFIQNWATIGGHCKQLVALDNGKVYFATLLYPWATFNSQNGQAGLGHGTLMVLKIDSSGYVQAERKTKGHWTDDAYIFPRPDGGITVVENYIHNYIVPPPLKDVASATPLPEHGGIRVTKLDGNLRTLDSHEYDISSFLGKMGDALITKSGKIILFSCDNGIPRVGYIDADIKSSSGEKVPYPLPALPIAASAYSCGKSGFMETGNNELMLFLGVHGYTLYTLKTSASGMAKADSDSLHASQPFSVASKSRD